MAQPTPFFEANCLLVGPEGDESIQPLPVRRDGSTVVSCWQLSVEDLRRIAETGEVWLSPLWMGIDLAKSQVLG